jgi:LmbE family N-acetylglucosaminyl deacetylase
MDMDLRTLLNVRGPVALDRLPWPDELTVVILAPHPDDFDAIGVTMRFFQQRGSLLEVGVARSGGGVQNSYRPGLSLAEQAAIREQEQRSSLCFFGLPEDCLTFFSLEGDDDDQPVDSPGNRDMLASFVAVKAPDIVILPHGNDTNSGHRAMYSLLNQIARAAGSTIVALLNRDPKTITMRTDLYMPFGGDLAAWKAELLRFHDTQHQRNLNTRGHGFDDRILEVNRTISRELSLGVEYAEAFEVAFLGYTGSSGA